MEVYRSQNGNFYIALYPCSLPSTCDSCLNFFNYDPGRAASAGEAVVMNSLQTVVVVVHLFTRLEPSGGTFPK